MILPTNYHNSIQLLSEVILVSFKCKMFNDNTPLSAKLIVNDECGKCVCFQMMTAEQNESGHDGKGFLRACAGVPKQLLNPSTGESRGGRGMTSETHRGHSRDTHV